MGIDIDGEEDLAVVDGDLRQHARFRQGHAARRPHLGKHIQDLLLRDAQDDLLSAVELRTRSPLILHLSRAGDR